MRKTLKGWFTPVNPNKYRGDPTNIIYRSSWELRFMKYCDLNSSVLSWESEEFCIQYRHPMDSKIHRYFPDFKIQIKTREGITETWVIEIKPYAQTQEPKTQKKKTKRFVTEVVTYAVNKKKWEAAQIWCENRKFKFMIFTENELGIK